MNILTAKVAKAQKASIMGKMPRRKEVLINGTKYMLYSIGWLAHLIGKHVHTIRQYEKRQVLPPPILSTKSRARFYLAEEISGYAAILKSVRLRPHVSIESTGLRDALYNYRNRLKAKMIANITAIQQTLKQEQGVYDYAAGARQNLIRNKVRSTFPKV